MRYIMIDSADRKIWDCQVPWNLTEDFFAAQLRCEIAWPIELTDGLDLWVSSEPKMRSFRFFADGPEYAGDGILAGRSRMAEIKGLARCFNREMIEGIVQWPKRQVTEERRPIKLRPAAFPQVNLGQSSYLGIAPSRARETPYVMQMYG